MIHCPGGRRRCDQWWSRPWHPRHHGQQTRCGSRQEACQQRYTALCNLGRCDSLEREKFRIFRERKVCKSWVKVSLAAWVDGSNIKMSNFNFIASCQQCNKIIKSCSESSTIRFPAQIRKNVFPTESNFKQHWGQKKARLQRVVNYVAALLCIQNRTKVTQNNHFQLGDNLSKWKSFYVLCRCEEWVLEPNNYWSWGGQYGGMVVNMLWLPSITMTPSSINHQSLTVLYFWKTNIGFTAVEKDSGASLELEFNGNRSELAVNIYSIELTAIGSIEKLSSFIQKSDWIVKWKWSSRFAGEDPMFTDAANIKLLTILSSFWDVWHLVLSSLWCSLEGLGDFSKCCLYQWALFQLTLKFTENSFWCLVTWRVKLMSRSDWIEKSLLIKNRNIFTFLIFPWRTIELKLSQIESLSLTISKQREEWIFWLNEEWIL